MLFDVCDAMSLSIDDEFLIYPMNAELGGNAIATVLDENRLIVYDRNLSPIAGYNGARMIIAHELAHHYCKHLGTLSSPNKELQADAFSGVAMRLMGQSLDNALAVAKLFNKRPSVSHPTAQDRIQAITDGWKSPNLAKACKLP